MRSGGFKRPERERAGRGRRPRTTPRAAPEMPSRLLRRLDSAQASSQGVADAALHADVCALLAEIDRQLAQQQGEGVADVRKRLAEQDLGMAAFREPQPQRQEVLSHLPECLAEAAQVQPMIAAQLAALETAIQWQRSPGYTDLIMGNGFNANYGWAHIIGPHGFFPGDDFLLGVLMLGPDRHYPDRYQPAPELCWPLTPESFWSRDGKPFFVKQQGTTIWHPSMATHATMTGSSPLLALWFRTRDTASPTRLKWG
jgi:hypothetical protein